MKIRQILFIVLFLLISCDDKGPTGQTGLETRPLSIQTVSQTLHLTVEVADDAQKRATGLMFRQSLDDDKGMLFIFEAEGYYSFYMKNTYIPLDIIYISADKMIVYIAEDTTPLSLESIVPSEAAQYILEVNAGYVQKNGVQLGDNVTF